MKLRYRDAIELSADLTLREAEAVEDFLRSIGEVEKVGRSLRFSFEAEDLWEACERAYEVSNEMAGRGMTYTPEKTYIEEVQE